MWRMCADHIEEAKAQLRTVIVNLKNKDLEVEILILGYQDLTLTGPYHEAVLQRPDTIISLSQFLQQKIPT
jgi:hypothetical protein